MLFPLVLIDNAGRRCKIQSSFLNPGGFLWALEQNRRRNRFVTSTLKTKVKRYSEAIGSEDLEKSQALLKELVALTDKAATKGVIHKKKASRYVSRFSKKLSDLSQSAGS